LPPTITALGRWGGLKCPPTTAAEFIIKSSLIEPLSGFIRPPEQKLEHVHS